MPEKIPGPPTQRAQGAKQGPITKTAYMRGGKCELRPYLDRHGTQSSQPVGGITNEVHDEAILRARPQDPTHFRSDGYLVEALAEQHLLFRDGIKVPSFGFEGLLATHKAIREVVKTIFQSSFQAMGLYARPDILTTGKSQLTPDELELLKTIYGGEYGRARALYEVKSTASVKPEHIRDIAFQFHTLRLAGVNLKSAYLMHVNKDFVRLTQDINPKDYFIIENVTSQVLELLPSITSEITQLHDILVSSTPPTVVPTTTRCGYRDPSRACPHISDCWSQLPKEGPIQLLPRLGAKKFAEYQEEQKFAIADLDPTDKRITANQLPVVQAFESGQPVINLPGIKSFLENIQTGEAITFIDFETYSSAIPLIGSQPFVDVPIQFASCIKHSSGFLEGKEFLSQVKQDQSRLFAENLLESVADSGPIVVWYKSFEAGVIKGLAERFADLSTDLLALNTRMVDLMVPFKRDYVDSRFEGSTSLKNVLPAIAPDMAYDQMAITSGSMVASKWVQMLETQDPDQKMQIMMELKKYCMHDVNAMLRIYNFLDTLVKQSSQQS